MPTQPAFKYAFISAVPNATLQGGAQNLLIDCQNHIEHAVGTPPPIPKNDAAALLDENCLLVCINPHITSLRSLFASLQPDRTIGLPPALLPAAPITPSQQLDATDQLARASRWLGVSIPNGLLNAPEALTNILFSFPEARTLPQPHQKVFPIRALPSRVTPKSVKDAAQELAQSADFFILRQKNTPRPITTFILGDLSFSWGPMKWNPKTLLTALTTFMTKRQGQALSTTSPRTERADETRFIDTIDDWSTHHFSWKDQTKHTPNPYLGLMGIADEIVVTADSLSMISDALASGKPVRLWHGWPVRAQTMTEKLSSTAKALLSSFPAREPSKGLFDAPALFVQPSFARRLINEGVPTLYDDPTFIKQSPPYDTGCAQAFAGTAQILIEKARRLSLASNTPA